MATNLYQIDGHQVTEQQAKWKRRLAVELSYRPRFERLSEGDLRQLLQKRKLLSMNHDTVAAIDWPHYCANATEGCGGVNGWCYTFGGHSVSTEQASKVAMVDVIASNFPELFASQVASEIGRLVASGRLPYANVRYSGSGEVHLRHVGALERTAKKGIHIWGFTKSLEVARRLRASGIASLFSCDLTTAVKSIEAARDEGFGLAYTSISVHDVPPVGTIVTFPLHTSGSVRELVSVDSLCPKVVDEYYSAQRTAHWCQTRCFRCHRRS